MLSFLRWDFLDCVYFFFQAEGGIRGGHVTGVQTCALPISPRVRDGLELMAANGLLAAVLPELDALRGVGQSVYHHADVLGHTLEVLDAVVAMEADPAAVGLGDELAAPVAALLSEPLANELTRGTGLRFAALLHDAAKPQTRGERPDGRVTFVGHDSVGAELAR